MKTNTAIKRFKIYLNEQERSENAISKYMHYILFFMKWLYKKNINKSILIEYKSYLCSEYAPKSVNSMLSSLNALFDFMGRRDCDLKIKTLKIQWRVFSEQSRELTKRI